jgi:hypothetical protein
MMHILFPILPNRSSDLWFGFVGPSWSVQGAHKGFEDLGILGLLGLKPVRVSAQ